MTRWGVVRQERDPADKRVQRVYLTEQGKQLESLLIPEAECVNAQALQGFTEEEVAFLIDFLSRACANMQKTSVKERRISFSRESSDGGENNTIL
ncbi:hypothetical protein KSZ_76680 [Dictyobacter formicarum]|uniref:HTH marR-type domain-containing protein n=2 Tax=Dictyobacter formicarum TaxID=2778368 RepID=A0ABQ3VUV0_9CHLR|nr:hypothetical protein KSZ_76680 [Dictyobacter formicarum]